jgi:hypothetical protein
MNHVNPEINKIKIINNKIIGIIMYWYENK